MAGLRRCLRIKNEAAILTEPDQTGQRNGENRTVPHPPVPSRKRPDFSDPGGGLEYSYVYHLFLYVRTPAKLHLAAEDEVSDYVPSTRPGARLPHAWVETSEGRRSTHEFIAYDGYTLFASGTVRALEADADERVAFVNTTRFDAVPWGRRAPLVRPDLRGRRVRTQGFLMVCFRFV